MSTEYYPFLFRFYSFHPLFIHIKVSDTFSARISGIQLIIFSTLCHELLVIAALNDTSLFKDNDAITVADSGEAMRDNKCGSALHQAIHALLYDTLRTGVDGAGGLI